MSSAKLRALKVPTSSNPSPNRAQDVGHVTNENTTASRISVCQEELNSMVSNSFRQSCSGEQLLALSRVLLVCWKSQP
ncbi:hypothetical protein AKJ16_DCAP25794 [Drosera capensis]